MRTPEALETLVDHGIVEEVVRPLMSGKEAQVYLVRSGGELRVAKVYKEAQQRSFKQRAEYTDGRSTRNSRDRRAIAKHTAYGRKQDEAAWKSAEVDAIYRLSAAGVRVPVPYHFIDGVLLMELVRDHEGFPASRLGDLEFAPEVVQRIFDILLASVVRMLCAGVVHGDLSEFNVLMAADGPVIIDFPQAVDPATNLGARKLLIRDVDNLQRFISRHVREFRPRPYAQEMWELYQQNLLTPETQLLGRVTAPSRRPTDTSDVLAAIGDAERQHRRRSGGPPRGPKVEVIPGRSGPRQGKNEAGPGQRASQPGPRTNEGQRPAHPRSVETGPRSGANEGQRRARSESETNQRSGQRPAQPRPNVEEPQRGPKVVASPQPAQRPSGPAGEQASQASSGRRRRRRSRGGRSNEPGGGDRSSAEGR
jgi:RIO kinase 1